VAKIQMVCSEALPFASTGGMADVLSALPKALVRAGEAVAVVLPLYRDLTLPEVQTCYERLPIQLGLHRYSADVLFHDSDGVRYFFLQIPELFDRSGLYGIDYRDFADNHLRFGALCQAALRIAEHIFHPDVLHCHDWQSGLVPLFLRKCSIHPYSTAIKTLFTIHNLAYQGSFDPVVGAELGIPDQVLQSGLTDFDGQFNFLKTALVTSDLLSTVSPRYAREIQTPAFGQRLDGILRSRSRDLVGILNGVDYQAWDAASDPDTPCHFSRGRLHAKSACKRFLLAELGLSESRIPRPLVSIVSRLVSQKGLDLLKQIPDKLVSPDLDLTLAVMGSGDPDLEDFFHRFASAYPDQVAFICTHQEGLANRMIAGADLFLMPSRYEPCGLNQLYAMRYGTLPLVRATGGLDDTVSADTGFKFTGDTAAELLDCIRSALALLGSSKWHDMVSAAMQNDFSWDYSALQYVNLYRRLLSS
jgi:starch synthase